MNSVDQDSTATSNFHPALEALAAGLCPVPPKMDGSKAPIGAWKSFQHFPPDETQIRKWYSASNLTGYGLVTSKVSGNLELFEFDCIPSYHRFKFAAAAADLGDLVDRIEAGYSEQTPKPGIHWLYHCPEIAGNTELASRPKTAEEMKHPKDKAQVLIETRGEGGFVIIAPSNGKTHPSGGAYQLLSGGFSSIATITPDERRDLFALARTFHVAPAAPKEQVEKGNVRNHRTNSSSGDSRWQVRPGDDFNANAVWRELLEAQGWTFVYRQEERDYWRRPGKNQGVSACTNWEGKDYFYCFSTSTEFEAEKPIDKVGFHAQTMHGGNFKAAIMALAEVGYGTPAPDAEKDRGHRLANGLFKGRSTGDADDDVMPETVSRGRIGAIRVKAGEYPEAMDAAEQYLITADAGVFQRGYLCRVSREPVPTVRGITRPVGTALMIALTDTYLRNLLDRLVEWEKWDGRAEDWRRCSVPPDVAKRLLENAGDWHFPVLTGVITSPTLRPDGSLLTAPGYDATTGLFFDAQGETFPTISDRPSREEGQAALAYLSREILENRRTGSDENTGFSFATPSSKSAALSALLTPLVRYTVPTAPFHLISARRAGSGKSLLADAAALLATGKTATILDLANDDDEQEKRLLSVFMAGDLVVNLDNIERPLGGAHLNKALTAETFTGRILGLSKNATVPTTIAWFATGNNVIVKEDMTRRVVLCLLDPQTETPEKREYERNLFEWIPANRPVLVMAALTALRAYVAAGKPKQPVPPMGSFEDWHRLVRSALIWLGEADPLGDTEQMEDTDPARIKLRALIFAWHHAFKSIPATCKEAIARANATMCDENGDEVPVDTILRDVLTDHFADGRKGGISSRYLGEFISKNKGRIECGARFEAVGDRQRALLWRVKVTDKARFEAVKSESSESSESFLLEPEKLAEKFSGRNSSACAENNRAENNRASFSPRGESDSPDSPDSLSKPPTAAASFSPRGENAPATLALTPQPFANPPAPPPVEPAFAGRDVEEF
ncbi:MAG: bifunctional DNA primase/polymerase [Candidatus Competibacteraceae bacterium]